MSDERLMILKMIHDGKITPEQGESLLKALPSDSGDSNRQSPPPPPPPPAAPVSPLGTFFDLQGRLADVQVKLGELQSKLGAASGSTASSNSSSTSKGTVLPFGLGEVNVGQIIDEAVRGVNSLKSESVKSFKQAARTAQKEGRKIRDEAKKSGKNIRIELNINFDDDGRPKNDTGDPESTYSEEIPLKLVENGLFFVGNKLGNVRVTSASGTEPVLKFVRTAWSEETDELTTLNEIKPRVVLDTDGNAEQVVVDSEAIDTDHITLDLELFLPESTRCTLETTFGDIVCENRTSGVGRIESQTGSITLINIRGNNVAEGTVRTRSGSVSINQWSGQPLAVDAVSGNIDAETVHGTSVVLRSRSGDVRIESLELSSDLTIDSSSGDVELTTGTVTGTFIVRTQSGDVSIDGITTTGIKVESVSGDIGLTTVATQDGTLNLKSVSGDIVTTGVTTVDATTSTVSGDTTLRLAGSYSGIVNASTISGDLELFLASDSDVHIELSTQTGSVEPHIHLDQVVTNGPRFTSGNIGSGQGRIVLQTVSGDVTVKPQV